MLSENDIVYFAEDTSEVSRLTTKELWDDLINTFTLDSFSKDYSKMLIDLDMFTRDEEGFTKINFIEKKKNITNWHKITITSDIVEENICLSEDTLVKVNNKGFIPVSSMETGDIVPFWFYKSFFDIKVTVHEIVNDIGTGYNLITDSKIFIGSGLVIMSNEK